MFDQADQLINLIQAVKSKSDDRISLQGKAEVADLASRNRLYLALSDVKMFSDVTHADLSALRRNLHIQNSAVISLIASVSNALRGLDFVIFKGPVQQKVIHGTFFHKPAGDVDVLVSNAAFDEARTRLESVDLHLPHECKRIWWRYLLGEQHFVQKIPDRPTVDLHHRIQRPGCPSPRDIGWFLTERTYIDVGTTSVPTLSRKAVALVVSLNLVKALYDGESAGSHALDLATCLKAMNDLEQESLIDVAKRQGVATTLAIASQIARFIFGPDTPAFDLAEEVDIASLSKTLVDPDNHPCPWARGTEFLRHFSDDKVGFARGLAWYYASQVGRTLE